MLRLAAGGFRDMTRIASGSPTIWPDICEENRDAIVAALDELTAALQKTRDVVAAGDRASLLDLLEKARAGRVNLPARVASMAEMAIAAIPDVPRLRTFETSDCQMCPIAIASISRTTSASISSMRRAVAMSA